MTKDEIIKFFEKGDFSEVSREQVLEHLFLNGQIVLSDYLELQKFLEFAQMPILAIKEPVDWDADKWLEYGKNNKIIFEEGNV